MAQATNSIGVIGSGNIGGTLARLWAQGGLRVVLGSRHPEKLSALAGQLGERVVVKSPLETARACEVVLLAIPLGELASLDGPLVAALAGKVVLDANNPNAERDGAAAAEAAGNGRGSSAWVASKLPGAKIVKAFNTVYYRTLAEAAHRAPDRVAIPLAGDDPRALDVAERLVHAAGFEPLYVGGLSQGRTFDAGTAPWNTGATASAVKRLLGIEPGFTPEQMTAFVRAHFEDFVNRRQTEVALHNFSEDFLDHDEPSGPTLGPAPAKAMMEGALKRWPDLHVTVEAAVAQGDLVIVRNTWTATEDGSGKRIAFHGFAQWRFAHRKIVERWATLTPPQER